jgi:WD40 repeat protein
MPDPPSKSIFLSYGHDEFANFAERLKNDLVAGGYDVWFDLNRLKPGQDWESYIEEGINVTAANNGQFILLMTPHSVRRPNGYCLNELARAIQRNLHIVPVMLDSCEPPLSICRLQYLDMHACVPIEERRERYEVELAKLKKALEDLKLDFDGVQAKLLAALRPLDFDADIHPHLRRFIGREWIFQRIDQWVNADDESRVLWLTGGPGFGKTALASWYSHHRPEVAAVHFCRFGHTEKADPARAVLSIAYQLSSQYPDYRDYLNASLDPATLKTANAATLFDELIVQKLPTTAPTPGGKALIIIDGLDEATSNHSNPLAELIASEFGKTPDWLRLLVTSRPEEEVKYALQAFTPTVLDGKSTENLADARKFIAQEYRPFTRNDSVPEEMVEEILKRSEGIFLYLEWVRSELASGRLSLDGIDAFPQGLGGVYTQFFARQFPDKEVFKERFHPVLEAVVAAREPLDSGFLAQLFNWSEYDQPEMLSALGSMFVDVTGRVQPFHRSLVDWLTNHRKAGPYFVSQASGERRLADSGWKFYERDATQLPLYFLKHLPAHLAAVGNRQPDLSRLLLDFTWMRAKLDATEVYSLLDDYDFLTPGNVESDQSPRLAQAALRLSAHVLATHKNELPGQLTGRLLASEQVEIRRLLEQAARGRNGSWLKPHTPNLTPPYSSLMETLNEPAGGVNTVCITPDGGTVIYATRDTQNTDVPPAVKIWRIGAGDPPVTLRESRVSALAVSPDGSTLAFAADDRTVSIWSLGAERDQPLRLLKDLQGSVIALAFVSDAAHLMVVFESGDIQLWNLTSEAPELTRTIVLREAFPKSHFSEIKAVAVAPEANIIFIGTGFISADTWHEWDIDGRRLIRSHRALGFGMVAVTPDATRLVCGGTTMEVWNRSGETSQLSHTLPGHAYLITALAITPDGRHAVSASFSEIRVWDLDSKRVSPVTIGRGISTGEIAITSDGKQAVGLYQDRTMRLWDLATQKLDRSLDLPWDGAGILSTTGDGHVILGRAQGLHFYDLASGGVTREISTPAAGHCVAVTPDHTRALTASSDEHLIIWEIETGKVLHTLDAHFSTAAGAVALFPDGKRMVVSSEHSLFVWDLQSGQPVGTLHGHTWFVDALAVGLTPVGIRIISGSRDKTVRVWDPNRAEPLLTLTGHTYTVGDVGILPGGLQLISCGDSSLRIWNMLTGQCEATFTADSPLITCACTPDGNMIVAGDLAGQVHFLEFVGATTRGVHAGSRIATHEI